MFSFFLILFQPIMAWNVSIMVLFNFLIFFAIFLEFLLRVGLERNGTIIFIFSLSWTISAYFGLKWIHNGIFEFFLLFLWYFLLRVGLEQNGTIIFIFSLSRPFPPYYGLNESIMVFFNFFAIFLEFSIMRRVGTEWKDNFYFLHFSDFSNLFWHEMKS